MASRATKKTPNWLKTGALAMATTVALGGAGMVTGFGGINSAEARTAKHFTAKNYRAAERKCPGSRLVAVKIRNKIYTCAVKAQKSKAQLRKEERRRQVLVRLCNNKKYAKAHKKVCRAIKKSAPKKPRFLPQSYYKPAATGGISTLSINFSANFKTSLNAVKMGIVFTKDQHLASLFGIENGVASPTRRYGMKKHPLGGYRPHIGVDVRAVLGADIRPNIGMAITSAGDCGTLGNCVKGFFTSDFYSDIYFAIGHLKTINKKLLSASSANPVLLAAKDHLGEIGSSGRRWDPRRGWLPTSTGPHGHIATYVVVDVDSIDRTKLEPFERERLDKAAQYTVRNAYGEVRNFVQLAFDPDILVPLVNPTQKEVRQAIARNMLKNGTDLTAAFFNHKTGAILHETPAVEEDEPFDADAPYDAANADPNNVAGTAAAMSALGETPNTTQPANDWTPVPVTGKNNARVMDAGAGIAQATPTPAPVMSAPVLDDPKPANVRRLNHAANDDDAFSPCQGGEVFGRKPDGTLGCMQIKGAARLGYGS